MESYFWQNILVGILVLVTAYYAFQTHRQASLFDKQLKAMAEQRRKSIRPSLQIGKMSYYYGREVMNDTGKKLIVPRISLELVNIGSGPALDLKISATATIGFSYEDTRIGGRRKLRFELLGQHRDSFLERTIKPIAFSLDLTDVEMPNPQDKAGLLEVKLEYWDIDQTPFSETKVVALSRDMSQIVYVSHDEDYLLPFEQGYPAHLPSVE